MRGHTAFSALPALVAGRFAGGPTVPSRMMHGGPHRGGERGGRANTQSEADAMHTSRTRNGAAAAAATATREHKHHARHTQDAANTKEPRRWTEMFDLRGERRGRASDVRETPGSVLCSCRSATTSFLHFWRWVSLVRCAMEWPSAISSLRAWLAACCRLAADRELEMIEWCLENLNCTCVWRCGWRRAN